MLYIYIYIYIYINNIDIDIYILYILYLQMYILWYYVLCKNVCQFYSSKFPFSLHEKDKRPISVYIKDVNCYLLCCILGMCSCCSEKFNIFEKKHRENVNCIIEYAMLEAAILTPLTLEIAYNQFCQEA